MKHSETNGTNLAKGSLPNSPIVANRAIPENGVSDIPTNVLSNGFSTNPTNNVSHGFVKTQSENGYIVTNGAELPLEASDKEALKFWEKDHFSDLRKRWEHGDILEDCEIALVIVSQ